MQEQKDKTKKPKSIVAEIISKINESESILIALSKDPTADELATAIGLSLYLDKIGKHAAAIYSGETPNIIEFLEPERRLEVNTDSLQDFIIAINKDKADHLRYKVEGDYVRVYITPYKTKISTEDLEFSHGDFNIGLVVALNVPNEESLDAALTSHGRILHDAEVINIAATVSEDFGQTQWFDPEYSSVSEMVAKLIFDMEEELGNELDDETATALLTGIFIATDRFSNGRTKPETMNMAARLMSAGADQQQISAHLALENEDSFSKPAQKKDIEPEIETVKNDFVVENNNTDDVPQLQLDEDGEEGILESKEEADKIDITTGDKENTEDAQSVQTVNNFKISARSALRTESMEKPAEIPTEENDSILVNHDETSIKIETPEVSFASEETENISDNFELPDVPEQANQESEKTSLDQLSTPYEETPAPDFTDSEQQPMMIEQDQQPVLEQKMPTASLSSIGAQTSVDESVMSQLKAMPEPVNAPVPEPSMESVTQTPTPVMTTTPTAAPAMQVPVGNPAPVAAPIPAPVSTTAPVTNAPQSTGILGKDYGAMMDAELKAAEPQNPAHQFIGGNPALAAAPVVADGPEENNVPGMDFSNPVEMSEDEQLAGTTQNNIGLLGHDYPTEAQPLAPSQVVNEMPHLAPLPHPENANTQVSSTQGVMPGPNQQGTLPNVGMPLPGDEILPPPPTPQIDFNNIQTAQPTGEPVLPTVDDNLMKSSVVVQPEPSDDQPMQPAQFAQPVVNSDPSAFHIPGM